MNLKFRMILGHTKTILAKPRPENHVEICIHDHRTKRQNTFVSISTRLCQRRPAISHPSVTCAESSFNFSLVSGAAVLHAAGLRGDNVDDVDCKRGDFRDAGAPQGRILLQRHRPPRLRALLRQGVPQVLILWLSCLPASLFRSVCYYDYRVFFCGGYSWFFFFSHNNFFLGDGSIELSKNFSKWQRIKLSRVSLTQWMNIRKND